MNWLVGGVIVAACIAWEFGYKPLRTWAKAKDLEHWQRRMAAVAPEAYRRRVEAEVAKRLDAERFEADVQRRLEAARSSEATREEV